MATAQKIPTHFHALKHLSSIDADKGVIFGASVIRIGPALGHGVYIDQKGLELSLSALRAQGEDGIKLTEKHDGEFEDIVGYVKDFRIDGDRVRGDVYLLENHGSRARIIEIAQKMAGQFGLSIESYGEDAPNPAGDGKLFRPDEIDAVALVPRPAANKGGFFGRKRPAKVDKAPKTNTSPKFFHMAKSKFSAALLTACTKFAEGITPDGGETPSAEAIAEVVTQAVSDVLEAQLQPAVEDAVNDAVDGATTELSARVKKLESGDEADPDEADKGAGAKNLAAIVRTELKKHFAGQTGADRPPKQGQDRVPVATGKTEFEMKADELAASGVKNFFSAAVNRFPALFQKHCEIKQGKQA